MELFSIEHATNFIPCTRCSAECAEAKERSPPPRYANRTRHRRHPREMWFWHADSIQACLSSTPPLLSLLNPRRNSHSSRSHPLHAQGVLFSIFLYPIVLCLAVYPWSIYILNIYVYTYIKFENEGNINPNVTRRNRPEECLLDASRNIFLSEI